MIIYRYWQYQNSCLKIIIKRILNPASYLLLLLIYDIGLCFHEDFKKQILAVEMMSRALSECCDAVPSNLDLILRWLTLRFFETNPSVMLKAIEFQMALFSMLIEKRIHMSDFEATGFIPYFIGKLGDKQDGIRKGCRQLMKYIAQCYPPTKVFNFLIQGLSSKNSRQRTGRNFSSLCFTSFNGRQKSDRMIHSFNTFHQLGPLFLKLIWSMSMIHVWCRNGT